MNKNDIKLKLNEIDNLLANEENLDRYLNEFESDELQISSDLNNKILNKLNKEKEGKTKILHKSHKVTYLDILKIAACTIFALIIWQTSSTRSVAYAGSNTNVKKDDIYNKIDGFMQNVNEFFMKPMDINFERRDK